MTTLSIPDMSCGHCKAAIERALSEVPGTVTVDLDARAATVSGPADLAPTWHRFWPCWTLPGIRLH